MSQSLETAYTKADCSSDADVQAWINWLQKPLKNEEQINLKLLSKNYLPIYLYGVPRNRKEELLQVLFDVDALKFSSAFGLTFKKFRLATAMNMLFESESGYSSTDEFIQLEVTKRVLPLSLSSQDLALIEEITEFKTRLESWGEELAIHFKEKMHESARKQKTKTKEEDQYQYQKLATISKELKKEGELSKEFYQKYIVDKEKEISDLKLSNNRKLLEHLNAGILPTVVPANDDAQIWNTIQELIKSITTQNISLGTINQYVKFNGNKWIASTAELKDKVDLFSIKCIYDYYIDTVKNITITGHDSWFISPTRNRDPLVYFFLYYYDAKRTFPFSDSEKFFFQNSLKIKQSSFAVVPPQIIEILIEDNSSPEDSKTKEEIPDGDDSEGDSISDLNATDATGPFTTKFWNRINRGQNFNEFQADYKLKIDNLIRNVSDDGNNIFKNITENFFKEYDANVVSQYVKEEGGTARPRRFIKYDVYNNVDKWDFDKKITEMIEDIQSNKTRFKEQFALINEKSYVGKSSQCGKIIKNLDLSVIRSFNNIRESTDETIKHVASIVPFLSRNTCINIVRVFMTCPRYNVSKNALIMHQSGKLNLDTWGAFPLLDHENKSDDIRVSQWRLLAWICEMELVSSVQYLVDVLKLHFSNIRVQRELAYASVVRGAIHRAVNLTSLNHDKITYDDMLRVVPLTSSYKLNDQNLELETVDVYGANREVACIKNLQITGSEPNQMVFNAMSSAFKICEKVLANSPFFVLNSQYLISHHEVLTRLTCSTLLSWTNALVPDLVNLFLPDKSYFEGLIPKLEKSMVDTYPNMAFAEDYLNTIDVIREIMYINKNDLTIDESELNLIAYVNHVRLGMKSNVEETDKKGTAWQHVFLHPVQVAIFCLIAKKYIESYKKENRVQNSASVRTSERNSSKGYTMLENNETAYSSDEEEDDNDDAGSLEEFIVEDENTDVGLNVIDDDDEDESMITQPLPKQFENIQFKTMSLAELLESNETKDNVNPYHYTNAFNNHIYPFAPPPESETKNYRFSPILSKEVGEMIFDTCFVEIIEWRNITSYSRPIVITFNNNSKKEFLTKMSNSLLLKCLEKIKTLDSEEKTNFLSARDWTARANIVSEIFEEDVVSTMHINDFLLKLHRDPGFDFNEEISRLLTKYAKEIEDDQGNATSIESDDDDLNSTNLGARYRHHKKLSEIIRHKIRPPPTEDVNLNLTISEDDSDLKPSSLFELLKRNNDKNIQVHAAKTMEMYTSTIPLKTISSNLQEGFLNKTKLEIPENKPIKNCLDYHNLAFSVIKNLNSSTQLTDMTKFLFPGPFINPHLYVDVDNTTNQNRQAAREISWNEGAQAFHSHLKQTKDLTRRLIEKMGGESIPFKYADISSDDSNPSTVMQSLVEQLDRLINDFASQKEEFTDPDEGSEETQQLWRRKVPQFLQSRFLDDLPEFQKGVDGLKLHATRLALAVLLIEVLNYAMDKNITVEKTTPFRKLANLYGKSDKMESLVKGSLLKHPSLWSFHDVMILYCGFDVMNLAIEIKGEVPVFTSDFESYLDKKDILDSTKNLWKTFNKIAGIDKKTVTKQDILQNKSHKNVDILLYSDIDNILAFKNINTYAQSTLSAKTETHSRETWICHMYPPAMQEIVKLVNNRNHAQAWNKVHIGSEINLQYDPISKLDGGFFPTINVQSENGIGHFKITKQDNDRSDVVTHQLRLHSAFISNSQIVETETRASKEKKRKSPDESTDDNSGNKIRKSDAGHKIITKHRFLLEYDGRSWEMLLTGNGNEEPRTLKSICAMHDTYVSTMLDMLKK